MGAAGGDAAVFQNNNAIGLAYGRNALGDDDFGAVWLALLQSFGEVGFGFQIEGAGGVVKNDDFGFFEQRSGDGKPLFLPAGEAHAAFGNGRWRSRLGWRK